MKHDRMTAHAFAELVIADLRWNEAVDCAAKMNATLTLVRYERCEDAGNRHPANVRWDLRVGTDHYGATMHAPIVDRFDNMTPKQIASVFCKSVLQSIYGIAAARDLPIARKCAATGCENDETTVSMVGGIQLSGLCVEHRASFDRGDAVTVTTHAQQPAPAPFVRSVDIAPPASIQGVRKDHEECHRPPEGWTCSRDRHHEGSCAARPKIAKGDRLHITTHVPEGVRAKGMDTQVSIMHEDGTQTPLPGVRSCFWVDSRQGYCEAVLVVGASLDADAVLTDVETMARRIAELEGQLAYEKRMRQQYYDK